MLEKEGVTQLWGCDDAECRRARSSAAQNQDGVLSMCPPLPFLFQDLNEETVFAKPNIYCHFAEGIREPKYLPVPSWPSLNKLLGEALDSYNEVNAAMNLVSSRCRMAAALRELGRSLL